MKRTNNELEPVKILTILILVVITLWVLTAVVISYFFSDWGERGTFGDAFGSINALFSGLAFASLIYTILLQRKELHMQRKELTLQREEVSRSTQELRGQKELLNLQRFENTFFHLLSLHNEIINTIETNYGNDMEAKGKYSFYLIFYQMRQVYWSGPDLLGNDYEDIYKNYYERFGHYIRNILQMIKHISQAEYLKSDQKEQYYSILKAQLSTYELAFIYYYVSLIGDKDNIIGSCIEQYNLLEYLDKSILLHNDLDLNSSRLKEGNNIS